MNWAALADETVDALRRYLAIDTTNPPGNEAEGARFLAGLLAADGVASDIAESAPGRANLAARLSGDGSLGAIVLHHHIDVVYADRRYWSVDPFGGAIRDGYLYGRGALDMKSTGILQLMAFLALKRAGARLTRDLILLATADEEAGSAFGARWVVEHRRHWLDGAEYALSEFGGIQHRPDWSAPLGLIDVSEKTGLPLRLTARGEPGHGSMPWPDTAPHRLIRALGRLLGAERPLRVLPEIQELFAGLARVAPGEDARRFGDLAAALGEDDYRARFLANKHFAAMVRTTFAVNMLRASEKRNVIPPEAVADIDCRLLAGDEPDEITAWVRRAIDDPQVEVEVLRPPKRPNLSPPDTELYKALARALVARRPDVVVAPQILTGFTDNWTFRECGLTAYGWSPLHVGADGLGGVHGNDERVEVEDLRQGVRHYTEMLLDIAGR